jgi:SLT domain-containing protein
MAAALKTSEQTIRKQLHEIRAKGALAAAGELTCSGDYSTTPAGGYTYVDRYGRRVALAAAIGDGVHTISVRQKRGRGTGSRSGRARKYRLAEEEHREYLARQAEEEEKRRREVELRAPLERKALEVLHGARVERVCGENVSRREFLIGAALLGVQAAKPALRQARKETMRELVAASRGVVVSASSRAAAVVMRYAPPSVAAGLKASGGSLRADPRVADAVQEALVCAELMLDRRLEAYAIEEAEPRPLAPGSGMAEASGPDLAGCAQVIAAREVEATLPEEEIARLMNVSRTVELTLVWPDGSTSVVAANQAQFRARRPGRPTMEYDCIAGANIVMPGDFVWVLDGGRVGVAAWGACGPPVVVARSWGFSRDGPAGERRREDLMAVRRRMLRRAA